LRNYATNHDVAIRTVKHKKMLFHRLKV